MKNFDLNNLTLIELSYDEMSHIEGGEGISDSELPILIDESLPELFATTTSITSTIGILPGGCNVHGKRAKKHRKGKRF